MPTPNDRLENYQIIQKGAFSSLDSTDKMLYLSFLINGELKNDLLIFKERPSNVNEFEEYLRKKIGDYYLSLIDDYRMQLLFFGVFDCEVKEVKFFGLTATQYTYINGDTKIKVFLNKRLVIIDFNGDMSDENYPKATSL